MQSVQSQQIGLFDPSTTSIQAGVRADISAVVTSGAAPLPAVEVAAESSTATPRVYTLEVHKDLFSRLAEGLATLDEYKTGFNSMIMSEQGLKAEIAKLTKDQILKMMPMNMAYMYKSEKKERCIDRAYRSLRDRFALHRAVSYLSHEKYEDVIQRMVEETTEQDMAEYVSQVDVFRKESRERVAKYKKALENPETMDEFEIFVEKKGEAALSAAQRLLWDELRVQKSMVDKVAQRDYQAVAQPVEDVKTDMVVVETIHTRHGHKLWVVKMSDRVERSKYLELKSRAQRLGGRYSSYNKDGAVPGFQFKDQASAEQFISNDRVSVVDKVETRNDEKQKTAAAKLKEMADRLEKKGEEKLNKDRQANTARRARMAASAEADAQRDIAMAKTMRNLAEAIESGEATYLSGIRTKVQIELLEQLVNQAQPWNDRQQGKPISEDDISAVTLPKLRMNASSIYSLANELKDADGCIQVANQLRVIAESLAAQDGTYDFASHGKIELAAKTIEKLDKIKNTREGWQIRSGLEERKRLADMGIETDEHLRMAIREFITFRAGKPKANRVKEMERALVGCKIPGFFPTPKEVAARMVKMAEIEAGMDVDEPQAGSGNIAECIREAHPGANLTVQEVNSALRNILSEKGFNLTGSDFLDHHGEYDRVVMNPPFEGGQDILHTMHAYKLLRPKGILVSIVSEGPFFRNDRKALEFRAWLDKILDEVGGTTVDLKAGTFQNKDLLRTTGVKSRIICIRKPF